MPQQIELTIEGGPDGLQRRSLRAGERLVLGRGRDADVLILDSEASRRHAALELTAAGVVVTDLGGANGTFLDERRLPPNEPAPAPIGAVVRIGAHRIRLGGSLVRDDYEPLGELGRGASATVYRARRRSDGREVAIKSLRAQPGQDATASARFLREGKLAIAAPQIVQVLEVRAEGDQIFIVMELVPGRSLHEALRAGVIPVDEALRITEQVALALAAAHAQGVVHRDVKPGNILLGRDGAVKLTDFGIAKEQGSVLTNTGQGIGTLDYVAPEQAEDAKRVSPAADLYALGATLYHMLAGRPPFDSRDPSFFEHLFEDDPPPLRKLRPDCPPAVAALVRRLLEKDPADRISDASTVAGRLRQLA